MSCENHIAVLGCGLYSFPPYSLSTYYTTCYIIKTTLKYSSMHTTNYKLKILRQYPVTINWLFFFSAF